MSIEILAPSRQGPPVRLHEIEATGHRVPSPEIAAIRERLLALTASGPVRDVELLEQALELLEPLREPPHSARVRSRATLLADRLMEWFSPHLLPQDIHVARQRRRMEILIFRLSASLANLD